MMDISVGHDEELKKQRLHERRMEQEQQNPEYADLKSNISEEDQSESHFIGESDPFELAYLQPVIRASPHARPEQPFPPAQLGKEEVLLGNTTGSAVGSTMGTIGEDEAYDDSATVRVQHHNQQNRRELNKWWINKMKQHEKQRMLHLLIGEECGTVTFDSDSKPLPAECGHFV